MLGKLATYLRMCGYDAAYALDEDVEADDRLLDWAASEDRHLLTRDARLANRADPGLLIESRDVVDQLREVRTAGLSLRLRMARCSVCNGRLAEVDADAPVPEHVPCPADTDVYRCRGCGQHFWRGSHWDDVAETLATVTDE
jgi:uncharacterized protein with PIN domain